MSSLQNVSTKDLVEELTKREGVDSIQVKPYIGYEVTVEGNPQIKSEGPAILINVID